VNCDSCSRNIKEDEYFKCSVLNYNRFLKKDYTIECPCRKCSIMIACTKECDQYEGHCLTPLAEYNERVNLNLKTKKESKCLDFQG